MAENEMNYRSPTYYELAAPPELDWRKYRDDDYFEYRRQWNERPLAADPGGFPLHLDIDPTNRCNLGCVMCPRTYYLKEGIKEWNPQGRPGDMDFSLYEAMVEEGAGHGLKSVKLNFLGEPILYKRLTDMVRVAAEAGLWTMINTNATLLNPDISEKLLAAGLTDIFFSFDSPYPEEYEKVRLGAKFDNTIDNIRQFINIKDKMGCRQVQTRASMVLPRELDGPALEKVKNDYIRLFRDLSVAEIGFGLPSVMGLDYEKAYGLFPGFVCPDLFRRMFVFWDGPAGPCCGDWERKLIMGDATREPLSDIWKSDAYQALRKAHVKGSYSDIPVCRRCSVPYLSTT